MSPEYSLVDRMSQNHGKKPASQLSLDLGCLSFPLANSLPKQLAEYVTLNWLALLFVINSFYSSYGPAANSSMFSVQRELNYLKPTAVLHQLTGKRLTATIMTFPKLGYKTQRNHSRENPAGEKSHRLGLLLILQ